MAVGVNLDFMMNLGLDFEQPDQFRHHFFEIRFTGCTGSISFTEGSNDRAPMDFDIWNMQYVEDRYMVVRVGRY